MIHFFFENITEQNFSIYQNWLENIILAEGKKLGTINYIFCNDDFLLKINQDYLQHNYYTDIITFDYVQGKIISGDIFVSLPRISDNSIELSTNLEEELRRVLAHGILHLCGYQDKSEIQQAEMRKKEDFYLQKWIEN